MIGRYCQITLAVGALAFAGEATAQGFLDPPKFKGEELSIAVQMAASAAGFTNCSAPLAKVAQFLSNGMDATYVVEPLGVDQVVSPILLTMESEDPGGGDRLSVANMNPDCSGMYTQTKFWPKNCSVIKTISFPNFVGQKTFMRNVLKSRSGRNLELFLLPAGANCVSVKKELFRF